jgi:Lanthionine synthetase C-like protein/HopA1 effector protein family
MMGQRDLLASSTYQRVYWNLNSGGATDLVFAVTRHLNKQRVPFRLKVLADPVEYGHRLDTAVTYLDLKAENARDAMVAAYDDVGCLLRDGVPSLTYGLAPGIAMAENPKDGGSFGIHRCRLIAEAFIRAAENGRTERAGLFECIERVFTEQGINLRRPYGLERPNHRYIGDFENAIRVNRRHAIAHPPLPERPREIDPWLAVATEVGNELVSEAISKDGYCQWVDQGSISANSRMSSTLPASLYTGTAGIGHFLAELAVRINSDEVAATALSAMRFALAASAAGVFGGLYSGALGVTIVSMRAARALGDSCLFDQAAELAFQLPSNSLDQNPDLLHGLAGQITGLLILSEFLQSDSFKLRAINLGELLFRQARRHRRGWSWPNPRINSTSDLTGLSHGAAGVALALGKLWRCTGDQSFIFAASEAMAYEDSRFDYSLSNWPDYRMNTSAEAPTFPHFWCHGSAGVILSRLHLSNIIGLNEIPPNVIASVAALREVIEKLNRHDHADFCLCHGLAGNAEVLWEASRWGQSPPAAWQSAAALTARECWIAGAAHRVSSGMRYCRANNASPSLMTGRAGIGYAYLRLYDPSVPSVLAFDTTTWGTARTFSDKH